MQTQTQRPTGVTLLVIWLSLAGIIAAVGGIVQSLYVPFDPTLRVRLYYVGLGPAIPDQQMDLVRRLIGVILIVSGLGYGAAAIGLSQRRLWGRIFGIVFAIVAALGWFGVGIFTRVFWAGDSSFMAEALQPFIVAPIVIGLVNALPIVYLMGDQVRVYFGGEARTAQPVQVGKRPSMVTAFAILAAVSGVSDLITGGIGISLVFAGAEFVVAWGLWQLRNWARIGFIIVVVINSLFFAVGLPSLADNPTALIGAAVVGLLFRGYFIYWMATNGKYFE